MVDRPEITGLLPAGVTRLTDSPIADSLAHLGNLDDSQAHNKIPDDAWEYQIRKSLNDAAYNGLDYVPYCSTMPVQENAEEGVKFMWKKKGAK